jgi:hypothetical protein
MSCARIELNKVMELIQLFIVAIGSLADVHLNDRILYR